MAPIAQNLLRYFIKVSHRRGGLNPSQRDEAQICARIYAFKRLHTTLRFPTPSQSNPTQASTKFRRADTSGTAPLGGRDDRLNIG